MSNPQRVIFSARSPRTIEQSRKTSRLFRRFQSIVTITTLIAASTIIGVVAATPALADSAPADPTTTPTTVTADALPTVQINGVVWQQIVVGNTVYVAGSFTSARPAGAAAGVNETPRSNILAYNLQTGVLISDFSPSLNAQANSLAISPDGTRLYVGGGFTQVNATPVKHLVALNPLTGELDPSFLPKVGATVSAIVATASTVYAGGQFASVGAATRPRVAAFSSVGATLLPWNPQALGGAVKAMVMSPDGSQLVFGGAFTSVNGSSNPGYGLASVNPVSGALLPLGVNSLIRNGGNNSAITSLQSDDTQLYGSGFTYGRGGNLEGVFSANWSDGQTKWVADCHGDTYSLYPTANAIYAASHSHYCGNIGGFPQTNPWSFKRATAFGKDVTGTIKADPYGYYNYAGKPRPSQLNWYPDINMGSFTGQSQGPWSVSGNGQYVVMGGEFTKVNRTGQQGLVRFAVSSIAPNKVAPVNGGNAWPISAVSLVGGTARITWPANWDQDNETLTYQVIRDGNTTNPIYTTTANSRFYQLPNMQYLDRGLVPGSTHTYKLIAIDPSGNKTPSSLVTTTISTVGSLSSYGSTVLADGASSYWGFDQASGTTTVADWLGSNDLVIGNGVSGGATGAIIGDSNTASNFDGTIRGTSSTKTALQGPNTFTLGAWVKTTSTQGGKIIGFGNASTGTSGSNDRHIYMDNSGKLLFGVYNGATQMLQSTSSYNDGQWHQIVASLSSAGMALYVDGVRVGQRSDVTSGQAYAGYWRVGGDTLGGWPNQPSSNNLNGAIDEVAVYPTALTLGTIQNQYTASGRSIAVTAVPTDIYGAAVVQKDPSLYWRFDETSGLSAADSSSQGNIGSYANTVALNQPGALFDHAGTAATFNGTSAMVAGSTQFTNPTTFSQALWFKTTTTSGGNLIGFGQNARGLSTVHDRQIYMENNGRLTFGTSNGLTNILTSTQSYNDGAWHMVVSTLGANGKQLYVDGTLVASNATSGTQNMSGYWKVGAEYTWGPQPYFAGTIDEAAVYPTVLTALDIRSLYQLGSTGAIANVPPVAYFVSTVSNLAATFDASGSSDSDGTIASYGWDFGDGTTGTGLTPSHTYTTEGSYQVVLSVTDNRGATNVVTKTVTATRPPNQPPVAAFIVTTSNLLASFDATASSDADGTVESYSWNFGDGTAAATGVSATHTYETAGSFQVTLTVTDNQGATTAVTKTATVTQTPPEPITLAKDLFARNLTSGLGSADIGGAWTLSNTAGNYSVADGAAAFNLPTAGSARQASLNTIASSDSDVSVTSSLSQISNGGGSYLYLMGRSINQQNDYRAKVFVSSTGALTLSLAKNVGGTETTLKSQTISGLTYNVGDQLNIRTLVTGTSPTTISAMVWKAGETAPATWQLTASDSTATLQVAAGISLRAYLSGSSTNLPLVVKFSDLLVVGSGN